MQWMDRNPFERPLVRVEVVKGMQASISQLGKAAHSKETFLTKKKKANPVSHGAPPS